MRILGLILLALLTAGCWTPGPGQLDPTRYPWDQPQLKRQARQGSYCIISLEMPGSSGISAGGQSTVDTDCKVAPNHPNR
jgi:hypothetical protein